ncbi:MAG: MBL fold metallo-hydrolase [Clostridia bacterium]|nr:MBL fold metallo-hydrolase [Clostridia bacterium]
MKQKLLFLLLTVCVAITLCLTVSAMQGSGTESDPYIVETADDFASIKSNLSAHYRLNADISVSSDTGAIVEGPFTGVFDGNGKTVTVSINAPTTQSSDSFDALFGVVSGGTVKNVTVTGSVKGSNKVAGVVGKLYNGGKIENCVNYATVYGRKNVAGISGVVFDNAYVKNCINFGDISGKAISNGVDLGGIVGCVWSTNKSKTPIINCANAGDLTGDGKNAGGICGLFQAGIISGCINTGSVSATSSAGTIIGGTENNTHTISGYFSTVEGDYIGTKNGTIIMEGGLIESAGVAIYLGSGSGIRGEFHVNKDLIELFKRVLSATDVEYGTVVSTKAVVGELSGDLTSEETQKNNKVVFAPAMKNGEILYSFVDESKGETYHSYRFALTNFPDNKQSYNLEFVILGYLKVTDGNGNTYMQYVNTVKSADLASNVEGTDLNAVNILRVAEVTIKDGDFNDNQAALDVLNHIVSLKAYNNRINIDGVTSYGHANATFTSHVSSGDTVVFEINNTFDEELSSYMDDLIANGYVKTLENEINGNYFYTYTKDNSLIHISHYPGTNEVNISSETVTALPDNLTEPNYQNKNGSSITQIKLADDVSIKEGMSYVIHLTDGTFLIIDGGWCYDDYLEADKLYDTLTNLAGEGNGIVIAGWIFTHCHGDHIGTFNYFVEKYHDSVTINQLLYNFPSDSDIAASASSYMLNDTKQRYNYFREVIATYLTNTEIVKLHSGYKFYYANAEIEILQTFEDLYPSTVASYDFNSSSTVFTVKIEGQKMLFVGDISDVGASLLNKNFGSALKSDFVQVAHHGLNSSSTIKQMYINSGASYVLYPAPNDWYRGNINNDANAYLQETESIKQIFVSGIDTFEIALPYDGSICDGDKVPTPGVQTEIERPETTVDVPDAYFDLSFENGTPSDSKGNATLNVVNGAVKETTVTHNGKELNGLAYTNGDNGTYYMNLKFNDITTEEQMKNFVMGSTTFEIFLKLDKLPGSTVGLITSCNGGGVTLYLRRQAGGQINFQMGSTSPNSNTDSGRKYSAVADMDGSGPVIEAGELLHIVGSYNSETNMMKLYLNGMLLCEADFGTGEFNGGSGDDTVIGIGYNPQYSGECISSYTDYELYEAKIYKVALTDEQVAQEYWNCIDNLFTEAGNE